MNERGNPPQAYLSPNARRAAGYPPPGSGPMPAYRPDSGPMRAYRPDGSGPMRAYRPDGSGPMRAYRPDGSGPMPAYRPDGRPAPAYRRADTSLLSEYPPASGPRPTYQPPRAGTSADHPLSHVKPILGWLPFGGRLVLLPKDLTPDGAHKELREHRDVNGGALRPAVFGAMDGLVTNASLIAGIGGGGGGHGMIVLTGIAGLIAGAFSMATGEYISVKSQNELTAAEVELERKQHARDPVGKLTRLAQVFVEKGVSPNLAEAVVRQISADPERAVAAHVREELGIDPDDLPSPRTAAVASFASFTVGALIPLSPFLVGYPVLEAALVIAGATAFVGGAALAKLTGRSMVLGGLRQFTAAFMATGMSFLVGHLISSHIS
jgi:vacuolar iron transporter family protein